MIVRYFIKVWVALLKILHEKNIYFEEESWNNSRVIVVWPIGQGEFEPWNQSPILVKG